MAQQVASGAGHGMPPAGANTAAKVNNSINSMEDLMKAGKAMADEVWKGVKGSKNARIAGLAALAAGAGWAAEKAKGHQQSVQNDFNKEQQMRKQLMSDG